MTVLCQGLAGGGGNPAGVEFANKGGYHLYNNYNNMCPLFKGELETSSIWIRNRSGPRIEPCGTPEMTWTGGEDSSLMTTSCV